MSLKVDVKFESPPKNVENPLFGKKNLMSQWTHRSVKSFPSKFGEGHFWITTKKGHESTTYTVYFVAQRYYHYINFLLDSKQPHVDLATKLEAKLSTSSEKGSFLKCRLNGKISSFNSPASLWSASVQKDREELAVLPEVRQQLEELEAKVVEDIRQSEEAAEKAAEAQRDLTELRRNPPLPSSTGIGWGTVTLVMIVSSAASIYLSYRFPLEQVKAWPATKFLLEAKERAWTQIAALAKG